MVSVLEDLEAGDVGVLEEDGQGVGVCVLGQAVGEVGLRALRVVVHGHVLLLLAEGLLDVVLLQAEAEGDHALKPEAEPPDLAAVLADYLPVDKFDTNIQYASAIQHRLCWAVKFAQGQISIFYLKNLHN